MYVVSGIALRRVKGVCPHKFQKINDVVYLLLLVGHVPPRQKELIPFKCKAHPHCVPSSLLNQYSRVK